MSGGGQVEYPAPFPFGHTFRLKMWVSIIGIELAHLFRSPDPM